MTLLHLAMMCSHLSKQLQLTGNLSQRGGVVLYAYAVSLQSIANFITQLSPMQLEIKTVKLIVLLKHKFVAPCYGAQKRALC